MSVLPLVSTRPLEPADRGWAEALLTERWGSPVVVSRGVRHDARRLPGFVALLAGEPAGLATYRIAGPECELVTLDALVPGHGAGSALVEAVREAARRRGCRRLWLITTNDNVDALRFYQRRGFELVAVHRGALEASRRLKPEIPAVGLHGIPLRDEMELELKLGEEAG
ncbi:MAG TPA: GNAT family N-acetyltransferase [Candidatus Saccharimonadales bacterium]|nr:GNAT family N-acetyltransferase [Candidatus Saccharimonadales bacterium]